MPPGSALATKCRFVQLDLSFQAARYPLQIACSPAVQLAGPFETVSSVSEA